MRRLTAAVLATAAVAMTIAGIARLNAAVDRAVRAEVAVADEGHPISTSVGYGSSTACSPGESYRLPAVGIRNHRGSRTAYRLVVSAGAAQAEGAPTATLAALRAGRRRDRRRAVACGRRAARAAGRRRTGRVYSIVLGVRPGRFGRRASDISDRAGREPRARGFDRAENLAMWVLPALVGAVLVVALVRGAISKPSLQPTDER